MFNVDHKMFLDRSRVFASLERKRQNVLRRTGQYSMTAMRNSIKRATKSGSSKPGEPPRSREGSLKRLIYYGFDEQTQSVVTGPLKFETKTKPASGMTTAELLDVGGEANIYTPEGATAATYAPRPFSAPAQEVGNQFFARLIESTPLK